MRILTALSHFLTLLTVFAIEERKNHDYDSKTIQCPSNPGVSITYKRVLCSKLYQDRCLRTNMFQTTVCETTPGVNPAAGYIRIPSSRFPFFNTSDPFTLSTFFWYFPARENPEKAPLVVYLAGGPGVASTYAAGIESGPCIVQPDNNSTILNPFSFNNKANVLYIDQPNFAGFSYDEVTDGLYDVLTGNITPGKEGNTTHWPGKFGSQNPARGVTTTWNAARVAWEVLQAFTADFPVKGLKDKELSFWGNSVSHKTQESISYRLTVI